MWRVSWTEDAARMMLRLPHNEAQRIRKKIDQLALAPRSPNNNVKALKGVAAFRLRIGDWRVIYELHDRVLHILVLKVAPRGSAND